MKIRCSVNETSTPLLIDDNLGSIGMNYNSSTVHAWNYSVGTVNITTTLTVSGGNSIPMLRHINLVFYSITSMGIGLPSVTVYRGSTVMEHYITGNGAITKEDSMRRNVSLSLTSPLDFTEPYTLHFNFENTDVEWLVLSEIELYHCPDTGNNWRSKRSERRS